jgi:hypothetical protein
MKRQGLACLVLALLVLLGLFSSPGVASSSVFRDSLPFSLSEAENYSKGFVGSFLKESNLELYKSASDIFDHDVRLAGGGGSGYKGGYKGSGKGHGYGGTKGSGSYQGSKGTGGYKDSQGKKGSISSKGAEDELKAEKEKSENPLPGNESTPQQVNH